MPQTLPQDVDGYDPFTDTTSTTGTGTLLLDGLIQSNSIFSFGFECTYNLVAVDSSGVATGEWEIGRGIYNCDTKELTRELIIASSDTSGNDVGLQGDPTDLSAGVKFVTFLMVSKPIP